ncbi:pilus assembly protein [Burkholderia vietnamiensis]|uniref:pilus assembly protein n=1 Tax=Burkholderia vietnamiensis TaxID=60552 RepID=UPI001593B7D0|nr:pilus assembly protein [Burkholderia vietnamiensis]
MTALAHRSMPGAAQRLGRVTRMSPAAAHAIGCVLAFAAVACGVIYLMDAADASGLHRSRALLATAHARVAAARRMLPTAAAQQRDRGSAALRDRGAPATPAWPALLLELADLAGASGLRIVSIEPGSTDQTAPEGRRTVRMVAEGGFAALLRLTDGVARFQALVVPTRLQIERKASAARMDVTLDVFPGLRPASMPGDAAAPPAVTAAGDPFGGTGEPMSDDSAPRLAGTIRDARAALALFESGNGKFSTVAPGDALGAARVTRVEAGAVTLATADGARRFVVDDGGHP